MDIRTGVMYPTKEDALKDGVPESDIAEINWDNIPDVKFTSGPFKNRIYKRNPITNNLVRMK